MKNRSSHYSAWLKEFQVRFSSSPWRNPSNYQHVYNALYGNVPKATSPKFHVGDKVRITRKKGTFEKGFTIKDQLGEPVRGSFYEHELQLSIQEIFRIERVIRKKKNQVYVKWKGYSNAFNSWIPVARLEAWISVSGMLGSQLETAMKTVLSFFKVCGDWLLERVDVEKLPWFSISCFNLAGWTIITCIYLERAFTSKSTSFSGKASRHV